MAKYSDYVVTNADGIDEQINSAQQQQQERQEAPTVDWEQRYKELEKLNSRQAQTLGEYRKTIDEFIAGPTSASPSQEPPTPITTEELYEDPNAALNKAVENHPAIQEARKLQEQVQMNELRQRAAEFQNKHPDFQEISATPEFQNWVADDPTRADLYSRADTYDFSAADALFRLYKVEKGLASVQSTQAIEQAELVSSSGEMVQEPPQYSRSEYINKLMRARQGDLEAEDWVKTHAANYRQALASGNVRD